MSEIDIKKTKEEIHDQFAGLKDGLRQVAKEETKGYVDVILKESVDKINDAISKSEDRLEALEKAEAQKRGLRGAAEVLERSPLAKAMLQYMRNEEHLTSAQKELLFQHKNMNGSSDPQGGYLVLPEMDTTITRIINETSPIRSVATVQSISSDQLIIPQQTDLPAATWTDVDTAPSETTAITWRQLTIKTHELQAEPRISQQLLDDAVIDVESYLMQTLAEAFDIAMNTSYVTGTGVGQPRGFLTYDAGTSWGQVEQVVSGSAAAITAAGINNLVYALKDGYLANAKFLMKRDTVRLIRLLVDGNGNALWSPAFGSEPALIMGYPVVRANDMPAVTTNTLPIAFGDWRRGYTVVDRLGMRLLRDPYTAKPFVKFFTTRRTGGGVVNYEAIKIQKCST